MARRMFDSVDVSQIPSNATMVAGYVDGHYQTIAELHHRFPHARIVTITVLGTAGANVADCEQGDLTPTSAARWAAREIQAGRHPTIYCSTSVWPTVKAAVRVEGISPAKLSYWVAAYPNTTPTNPQVPAGAVAWQFTDRSHGRNLDESVVVDHWPGVDPAPAPPKPPAPKPHVNPTPAPTPPVTEGEDVKVIRAKGTLPQYVSNGITRRWITSPAEKAELVAAGLIDDTVHDLDAAVVNAIALVGPTPR